MGNWKRVTARLRMDNYRFINELAEENGTDMVDEINRLIAEERRRWGVSKASARDIAHKVQ